MAQHWVRALGAACLSAAALLACFASWAASATVSLQHDTSGLYLSATTNWQPAPAVLDALQRGVPMTFIMQTRVLKPRWYWLSKTLQTTTRVKRLAYQPLTRQWRISSSTGDGGEVGGGVALHQNVDDLETALALVSRAQRWQIASPDALGDSEQAPDMLVRFSFKLDLSALPRPFQIGVNDNPDWQLDIDTLLSVPSQEVAQ